MDREKLTESRGQPLRCAWEFGRQDKGIPDMKGSSSCPTDGKPLRGSRDWVLSTFEPPGSGRALGVSVPLTDEVSGEVSGMMRFRLAGLGGQVQRAVGSEGVYYGELEGQGEMITFSSQDGGDGRTTLSLVRKTNMPCSENGGSRRLS